MIEKGRNGLLTFSSNIFCCFSFSSLFENSRDTLRLQGRLPATQLAKGWDRKLRGWQEDATSTELSMHKALDFPHSIVLMHDEALVPDRSMVLVPVHDAKGYRQQHPAWNVHG